jgi:alpha-tubulin suppressor-like RCC1 family protein
VGDGKFQGPSIPTRVAGLSGVTAIASGDGHVCALLSGGSMRCWGRNNQGQLGRGTFDDDTRSEGEPELFPAPVAGLDGARAVAAGYEHTCALRGGSVVCWGSNTKGQLGNGTNVDSARPVAVTGLTGAAAITAGGEHTCALMEGGSVRCWGSNSDGQLGSGRSAGEMVVSTVPVPVVELSGVTSIAAGYGHTCALLSDRTVRCWGRNGTAQLGSGSLSSSPTPVPVVVP